MGNTDPADGPITPWIRGFIRQQAQRVVRGSSLLRYEQEDVESDLRLHLLERQRSFNAGRGQWTTFARNVIENKASVLLDHHRADCRSRNHEAYSIDVPAQMPDGDVPLVASAGN